MEFGLMRLVLVDVAGFMAAYALSSSLFSLKKSMESETYRKMFPLTCRWAKWLNVVALTAVITSLVLSINAMIEIFDSGKSHFSTGVNFALCLITLIASFGSLMIIHIEGKRADEYLLDSVHRLMKLRGWYN